MSSERYFSYYYGRECEQFAFYRVPKMLITDPYFSGLSAEAKLLYGLMLDRMCLSQRNGWFDEQGRVFIIFPQKEIQRDLHIGKNTAGKLVIALEECGLIHRMHRGQGLPDLIYVMNFASGERPGEPGYNVDLTEEQAWAAGFDSPEEARIAFHGDPDEAAEQRESRDETVDDAPGDGTAVNGAGSKPAMCCLGSQEATAKQGDSRSLKSKPLGRSLKNKPTESPRKTEAQKFKKQTSGIPKTGTENKTDINKTNINNIYNKSSSSSSPAVSPGSRKVNLDCGRMNSGDYSAGLSYQELIKAVKEKIEYDSLVLDFGEDEVSVFPSLIAEMLYACRGKTEVVVGRITYNAEILRQRFLALTYAHIQTILTIIQENHISPGNIRSYYIQSLYNAAVTTDVYYTRKVDFDVHMAV